MALAGIILALLVPISGGNPILDDETSLLQTKLLVGKSGVKESERANQSEVFSLKASYKLVRSSAFCNNRGCHGGACEFSKNIPEGVQSCAKYVQSVPGCGVWFNYGTGDGWCDCVRADDGPCAFTDYSLGGYNVYKLDQASCKDKTLPSGGTWHDSDGTPYNCQWYASGDHCTVHGASYRNTYVANEACCACGGGRTKAVGAFALWKSWNECLPNGGQYESDLGKQVSVHDCEEACVKAGGALCNYFIFGKNGKSGNCWWEYNTACGSGNFQTDDYDIYRRKGKSWELQMAEIASWVYELWPSINGWTLLAGDQLPSQGDVDYFGVYHKDKVCIMAFAGSNSMADFYNNFDTFNAQSYCGLDRGIHSGFITELDGIRNVPKWADVEKMLSDESLCGYGIISVGHSLGAAMCEIFAACVNNNPRYYVHHKPNRPVDAIYSFAGPGPSKIQLTNGQSKDGCFDGSRYFNLDFWSGDSVPKAAYPFGYYHPKLKGVDLDCRRSWFSLPGRCTMHTIEYACGTEDAKGRPWTVTTPVPSLHSMLSYIARIADYYG